jgi:exopolysaccharide biosynthesis protein
VLLQMGQVAITNREERMFVGGEKDRHPRTAMGYTRGGKLIILAIEGRNPGVAEGATLEQEARLLQQLGCHEALNLDGGGSSCMLINGKETIKPSDKEGQRPVPAVFIIKTTQ